MKQYIKLYESENQEEVDVEGLDISMDLIEEIVNLVGSEEDVEAAAEEAYNELKTQADAGNMEVSEDAVPSKLALSALVVKLVEMGKLDQEKADEILK